MSHSDFPPRPYRVLPPNVIEELRHNAEQHYRRQCRRCWIREQRNRLAELALAILAVSALIFFTARPASSEELVTPDYPTVECERRGRGPTCPDPTPSPPAVVCPPIPDPIVNVVVVPRIERCRRVIQYQGRTRTKTRASGCRITFEMEQ